MTDTAPTSPTAPDLDPEICRRARLSRDSRFDGEFYLAVQTTGIYCRPICPARAPAEKNVRYFQSAALAAQAGFRPCLRCRPESAPDSPAWNGTSTTVTRALKLIAEGALNEHSLEALAHRLGIGERYLRKLFQRELGLSPQAIALNQRLLFAKKLLAETTLPMTEVAFAAGFGSVRSFNNAVQKHFRMPPGALRRKHPGRNQSASIVLQLQYRPPYDWEGVAAVFGRHAVAGVEEVSGDVYRRNIALAGSSGSIEVSAIPRKDALRLTVELDDQHMLLPLVARVRRMFDLDANPAAIHEVLGQDPRLASLLQQFPGIRSPGHWSLYEAAVRGIVGQQVSTQAARGIISRMAATIGNESRPLLFPGAAGIAALADDQFPMPGRRRETLRNLCRQAADTEEELVLDTVSALPGVGPWTTAVVAMRGSGQPDVFPVKDLGLEKAWAALPGKQAALSDRLTSWRPWRSYAANLLWRSLGT